MSKQQPSMRAVGVVSPQGEGHQVLPEETPVALVYNGSTLAVMMATPADLADFAAGFAITEGIVTPGELSEVEIVEHAAGLEARMWISEDKAAALDERRRNSVGPTGCGLCGIESLEQATRALPQVSGGITLTADEITSALTMLRAHQPLHDETHAVHAAGFYIPGRGIVLAREDVGRHNALDKLIGALAHKELDPNTGAIVLTSRISVDMVQKTALAGCGLIVAVSAPTAHAVRLADSAGITLTSGGKGTPRAYTHSHRITE